MLEFFVHARYYDVQLLVQVESVQMNELFSKISFFDKHLKLH